MPKRKATKSEATTQKALDNDNEPITKTPRKAAIAKPKITGNWIASGELIKGGFPMFYVLDDGNHSATMIAGFDIDWCLIKPKSGGKFPNGPTDWVWMYDNVPTKLKAAHDLGYRIVFFTNQAGIEKLHTKPEDIMQKIEDLSKEIGAPVSAVMTSGECHFRKPSPLGWTYFVEKYNKLQRIDPATSYFVGDAAGRKVPKDHGCTDRMFAANVKTKFYTPEEYFLGQAPAPFSWGVKNPQEWLDEMKKSSRKSAYHSDQQEMVLMVGCPASGKSSFSKKYFTPHNYVTLSNDVVSSSKKFNDLMHEALEAGKSVVIDNTNSSVAHRATYVNVAKTTKIPCRCFVMETPVALAHHLNFYRQLLTNGKVRRIPKVGYNVFKGKYEEPTTQEGFTEIVKIPFEIQFGSDKEKELFLMWNVADQQ